MARINGKSDLVTVETKSGRKRVNGNAKRLRESAHYPLGFGLALAQLIQPHGAPAASVDWFEWQNYFFVFDLIIHPTTWWRWIFIISTTRFWYKLKNHNAEELVEIFNCSLTSFYTQWNPGLLPCPCRTSKLNLMTQRNPMATALLTCAKVAILPRGGISARWPGDETHWFLRFMESGKK